MKATLFWTLKAANCLLFSLLIIMVFSIFTLLFAALGPGSDARVPLSPLAPASVEDRSLDLGPSKTFKLAIFSDLHFGEEEHGWGIEQDVKSTRVMRSVLRDEAPDLVVLNGDLITGENTFRENSSAYVGQVVAPMLETRTPWASAYGNHDSKFNLSREMLYDAERKFDLSYTSRMEPSLPGITNYYLLLHSPARGRRPVVVLWFFDSRGGGSYQNASAIDHDDIPNWVADETVTLFRASAARLRAAYGSLPSLAFVHIPPRVFLSAQENGVDPARFPGVNDDQPLAYQGEGSDDAGFIEALRGADGLHSVYVGHDHGNAWCSLWPAESYLTSNRVVPGGRHRQPGPLLCFSKHTGYGGYGSWNRGARVVELTFRDGHGSGRLYKPGEMEVETWVRMENHDIVTRISLNATYGEDVYPTENGE